MAKLPRYMKLEPAGGTKHSLSYRLTIKRWGVPIIVYRCLKENYELKWYHWLLYPYLCIKMLRGWAANG